MISKLLEFLSPGFLSAIGLMLPCITILECAAEQRNEISYLRGKYNQAFFYRHNDSYRFSAAFHYYHAKQHDVLQLTPLANHHQIDIGFDGDVTAFTYNQSARTEPSMELYGPYTAQMAWKVYRAIDWTHMHHEQTYDILSDATIIWSDKKKWTDKSVKYYLNINNVARSCAPLDITMRRAAVMMKPYFTYYRNYYPLTNNFAYVAHWWHPVIYEAIMFAGDNSRKQEEVIKAVNDLMLDSIFIDKPTRMLLSREAMPRYSRLTPESANIFDNLHMLHGIVYDILAYEGWTENQKRAELYRVVEMMAYRPGDEKYTRKFSVQHPDMDPRIYYDWMKGFDGEMNRIMMEMMEEMMPLMMEKEMTESQRVILMQQFKKKLSPDFEDGEIPGSLLDAMKQLMPDMKIMPESVQPGKTPQMMVHAMLAGWESKYGAMADIEPYPMQNKPVNRPEGGK
ncbi:MAG: hypothetical protein JW915_18210 [Chitinispirillaceae bacterium]|nr:hypothetical protein [Chitinispirillaceae bacterium]